MLARPVFPNFSHSLTAVTSAASRINYVTYKSTLAYHWPLSLKELSKSHGFGELLMYFINENT